MRVAFLHYTPKKHPPANFYYYGWGSALKGHEVVEKDCVYSSLEESDGDFDLCFVTPGFVKYKDHLYKKRSKTKYVLITDEDMHQPVEGLKCTAEYYDYVFVHSEINYLCLQVLGVRNVRNILPCYNPDIFYPVKADKKFDVAFLGQFDQRFDIVGLTRHLICTGLETSSDFKHFIGRGFYASQANEIYNDSRIALDLPIMTVVGGRSFCIGATTATLMLPGTKKTGLWNDIFIPGEDYIQFSRAEELKDILRASLERPDECLRIRKNMNKKVQKHTYAERFKEILNVAFEGNV